MDRIIRATAGGGYIKMAAVSARDTVERARRIHACSPTATAALGRTLCAASLLGDMLKEPDGSLTIRINGGGPAGSVIAVSDSEGYVRGYVTNPAADLPTRTDGKLDVGGLVGKNGAITVSRDLGLKEPYVGSTQLVSGEIAEDLTAYLLESEQIPSACGLGVLVDTDFSVKSAGGFIVQLMPGADDKLIDRLEDNITLMDALTTILAEDGLEEVFEQVLGGLEHHIVGQTKMGYRCRCSRERVERAVLGVGRRELDDMIKKRETVEVGCQFCDAVYTFTPEELRAIAERAETD